MDINTFIHPIRTLKARYFSSRIYGTDNWNKIVETDPKRAIDLIWNFNYRRRFPWDNPITLNEKITWLSGMTDTSLWSELSDKYEVRKYIERKGLGHILTNCYGIWENVDEIDFDTLPDSFAIKCTHDCGSTMLIHDKNKTDIKRIKLFLKDHLNEIMGYSTCEPHYTRIKPRIMAEELLVVDGNDGFSSKSAVDYKIWCINGKAEWAFVCYDRHLDSEGVDPNGHSTVFDLYDIKIWKPIRQYLSEEYKNVVFKDVPKPQNYDMMIEVAEQIANGFPEVRVDLYNMSGKIYFGEMTFTSQGGRMSYYTQEFQKMMGNKIKLPNI